MVVFGFGDFDVIQHPNSGSDVINISMYLSAGVGRLVEIGGEGYLLVVHV